MIELTDGSWEMLEAVCQLAVSDLRRSVLLAGVSGSFLVGFCEGACEGE